MACATVSVLICGVTASIPAYGGESNIDDTTVQVEQIVAEQDVPTDDVA